eukprot:scaffold130902_cov30-Tisochrysis_lutea.AAC.2
MSRPQAVLMRNRARSRHLRPPSTQIARDRPLLSPDQQVRLRYATTFLASGTSGRPRCTPSVESQDASRVLVSLRFSWIRGEENRIQCASAACSPTRNSASFAQIQTQTSFDRSEEAVVSALRFDHSLSPLSLEMSEASDAPGGDNSATYSGKLDIEAQNAFVSTWGVKSDAIDGVILSMFSRSGVHQHE